MSIEVNDYFLFDLTEQKSGVLPGMEKQMGPINTARLLVKKHLSTARQVAKKQELNLFGPAGSKIETGITAAGLAAWAAWLAYRHYKKSIADGKEPRIALKNRILFLHSSRSQCNMSMNPPECKRRIDAQIRKLTKEEEIRKEKE